jgi:hypothetical protein
VLAADEEAARHPREWRRRPMRPRMGGMIAVVTLWVPARRVCGVSGVCARCPPRAPPPGPHRPEAQDVALSRPKHGFESRWGRHFRRRQSGQSTDLVQLVHLVRGTFTSLQLRLVKTGGRLVRHARCYSLLLAESHLTHRPFRPMLRRIWALPVPTGSRARVPGARLDEKSTKMRGVSARMSGRRAVRRNSRRVAGITMREPRRQRISAENFDPSTGWQV